MHDPLIVSARGGIPLNMAKPARTREPGHAQEEFERLDVPVLGVLEGDAYADGGDRFWLDDTTAAIGLGYRTNRKGAQAAAGAAGARGRPRRGLRHVPRRRVPPTSCTCSRSSRPRPSRCSSSTSRSRPCGCCTDIRERGIEWIAIDRESYDAMGCNVLAVRPGVVVMVDGVAARAPRARGARRRGARLRRVGPVAQGRRRSDLPDRTAPAEPALYGRRPRGLHRGRPFAAT